MITNSSASPFARRIAQFAQRLTSSLPSLLALLLLSLTLAGLLPTHANAKCSGRDLRQALTADAQAKLKQQAAAIPFSQGNHWIASRKGQRIHIIGTQHSGDARMHAVMRRLKPLIKSADVVFLEQTAAQMKTGAEHFKKNIQHYLLPKGTTLAQFVSQEDWLTLRMIAPALKIPTKIAPHLQPWVYTMYFDRTKCAYRGLTSQRGLDARIERYASRINVPVGGLETSDAGLEAFSGRPLRDQAKYLHLSMNSTAEIDDHMVTKREAYFDENLTEGWLLSHQLRFSDQDVSRREALRLINQLYRRLLDSRNRAWLPVILRRREPVIFIAVGAAHLPGKNGVLSLLKRKGFVLQRAEF